MKLPNRQRRKCNNYFMYKKHATATAHRPIAAPEHAPRPSPTRPTAHLPPTTVASFLRFAKKLRRNVSAGAGLQPVPTAWEKHIVCSQAIGTGYKPAPAGLPQKRCLNLSALLRFAKKRWFKLAALLRLLQKRRFKLAALLRLLQKHRF
jgi:hypothetical protein